MTARTPGLYLHIPFCIRRCHYCAFPSSAYEPQLAERYLEMLEVELADRAWDAAPETIYIGGGTPTALPFAQLARVLEMVDVVRTDNLREFSVEANPGTLTIDKLMLLREAGVTRISLGVQSFHDHGLKLLGRIHTAKQARAAVAMCHEVGLDEISLDLIFGWPTQTHDIWRADLEKALSLDVTHLSCYGLMVEPETPIAAALQKGMLQPISEELDAELFDLTGSLLERNGMERYEISNFCHPGHACRHNINYWTGGDYIGLGTGAHSYLSGYRFANADNVNEYIHMMRDNGEAVVFREHLTDERRARECAVIWLRLREGIHAAQFEAHTGYTLDSLLGEEGHGLIKSGWLAWNDSHEYLYLTNRALPVADSILADLV